jgi:hypothetical protein
MPSIGPRDERIGYDGVEPFVQRKPELNVLPSTSCFEAIKNAVAILPGLPQTCEGASIRQKPAASALPRVRFLARAHLALLTPPMLRGLSQSIVAVLATHLRAAQSGDEAGDRAFLVVVRRNRRDVVSSELLTNCHSLPLPPLTFALL